MKPHATSQPPATRKQIAYIWTLAAQHGHNADAVRAMTPSGSLSRMSIGEASVLIEALKANRSPDYSRIRPQRRAPAKPPYKDRRPPRRPKGGGRLPTRDQVQYCIDLCSNLRTLYSWTPEQETAFFAGKRYSHGGPMNLVKSCNDCIEKTELVKGILQRAWKAQLNRQGSAQHVVAATG